MAKRKKQEELIRGLAPSNPNPTFQDWSQVLPQLLRAGQGETVLNLLPSAIHELNNAINTVLGFADLLQSEPSISKTLKEDLKAIERAGLRARELLGALRSLASRVPAQIQPMPVDLRELCEQVCNLMAASFRRNYIQLAPDYSPETPVIISDASRLRFVLLALLQNACDAIAMKGGGGKISVKTGRDQFGNAFVSIEDDGGGLSPDVRPKLFEPFVTDKPDGERAGLGLFLVKQFVTELQGKIEITSSETSTKVTLTLPSLEALV
ncbi:His Kinase A (phospho-acceptor) domain-containing protein [Candidatus Fervidibacteria bacterium JGI MDM2 SSWTFF-3-K9]